MKLKNKIAALSTLLMFQTFSVNAAAIDKELAVLAAEQDNSEEQVETFDPDSLENDKPKTKDELKAEEKRLEKEREEARRKIKEERRKSREELKGKTPISKNPAPTSRNSNDKSTPQNVSDAEEYSAVKEIPPVAETPPVTENLPVAETPPVTATAPVTEVKPVQQPRSISLPNPVVNYSNFNEMVQDLQFTPLYIPKKSGYDIISMVTINKIAEIRYVRKWEQNVSLNVRTYHRAEGEQLKDISGVQNVKWSRKVADGIKVYIAKVGENKNVATWAVGNYTFSAYMENLSFASFYSIVADELVDLSQHYYLLN